jgi:predicted nucleic acid-binding protein
MYAGEETEISLRADKSLLDVIFDYFGADTKVFVVDENVIGCNVKVQISPQFFGWCCSFGEKLRIVSPTQVLDELKNYVETLQKMYM